MKNSEKFLAAGVYELEDAEERFCGWRRKRDYRHDSWSNFQKTDVRPLVSVINSFWSSTARGAAVILL